MGTSTAGVFRHTVGDAVVVHTGERISAPAEALARAVRAEPALDNVVLDLRDNVSTDLWPAVADALGSRRRGIRLLLCGVPDAMNSLAGQWLADRLSLPVVAPRGQVLPAAGTLFVHATTGSGWMRYRPGKQPDWLAKRHPAPSWDWAAAEPVPTSAFGTAEPLPGGVWIRDGRDAATVGARWRWLASQLPCQPGAMAVVLGCPGTPPLALDDVARYWRQLGAEGRRAARFVGYGPVQLPAGETLGQALADVLASPVVCFAGIPTGAPDRPAMHTVDVDGGRGWQVFGYELGYLPRSRPTEPAGPPRILSHRVPPFLGAPVDRLTYQWTADAVVEVVQSGLWLRGARTTAGGDAVRARAADPARRAIVVDDSDPAALPRLQELAAGLATELTRITRDHNAIQLASGTADAPVPTADPPPQPAGGRLDGAEPVAEPPEPRPPVDPPAPAVPAVPAAAGAEPAAALDPVALLFAERVRLAGGGAGPGEVAVEFQEIPEPDARGLPTARNLDEARALVRRRYGPALDALAGTVSRALAGRANGVESEPEELLDAAALHLYLAGGGPAVDDALRAGELGDHVAFARCVAAGLTRLPGYRGAACVVTELSAAELRAVRERRLLTDWGFGHALTELPTDLLGNVDVLVWSMTARRTRLLEPVGDQHVDGRVVFLPGTTFKVLDAQEPAQKHRGRLMVREVGPDEPDQEHGPFDDFSLSSLHRYLAQRAGPYRRARVGAAAVPRLSGVPGLRRPQGWNFP